ncbi:MAG: efflux RND transporter permease subunit [Deltaproteobacteria bacterium]|nr:efflux RND transporter permease subunit [Deltaproteobacteria bacterium]
MSLSSLATRRPVTTLMASFGFLLLGVISLVNLSLDLFPDVTFPMVTITTPIGGYSPLEVENLITKPIEEAVSTLNNVHSVKSVSSEGESRVHIEFNLGSSMDFAVADIRERINLIRDSFPQDVKATQIQKYNPSEAPIMVVSAFGEINPVRLREMAEDVIEKRLKRIEGVANVEIKGGLEREILVEVNHSRLKALGLSISQVADALKSSNLNLPGGILEQKDSQFLVRTVGEYQDLEQIANVGLSRTKAGSVIYLKDIAKVSDSHKAEDTITRFHGESRVMLSIQKESGANILKVEEAVQKELQRMQEIFLKGVKVETVYNQADFIRGAIHRLRDEALIGGLLAMVMVWLFLRNAQYTLIVAAAIPLSILITFSFMYFAGLTLNIISLSGFTLGIGMLVDNSIVVVDSILKKRKARFDPIETSLMGTKEITKAITASTFAHIAVFLPVIFLQKKIRLMYSGLFFTVSFSLLASLAVALTLVPLFFSRKNPPIPGRQGKEKFSFPKYRRILIWGLRNRGKVISGGFALFAGSLFLIPAIGFEPMARIDRGEFKIILRTPPGTKISITDQAAKEVENTLFRIPGVKDVSTEVKEERAELLVRLVPISQREQSTWEFVEEIRPQITSVPRTQIYFDIERRSTTGNKIALEINGPDQQKLIELALKVKEKLATMGDLSDIVIHQGNPKPEMQIFVQHEKAGAADLNATQIAHAVRSHLTGPIVTEYRTKGKEIDLRVRLEAEDQKNLSVLNQISLPAETSSQRVLVPLGELSTFRSTLGWAEIHRKDQHRMIEMSAEIGKLDLARTAAKIEKELADFPFPNEYSYNFGENYQEMKESQKEMIFAFTLAVILVYMIFASLLESFVHPLTIMLSVPLAVIGSIFLLFLTGKAINIPVYVGAITLAGIVVNNSVVLIDYINLLRSKGVGKWKAIIKGGEARLRPILMTSGTTLLGLFPMALDRGEGSNLWAPLALTVMGGLITSTFLTLLVLPAFYSLIEDLRSRRKPRLLGDGRHSANVLEP